MSVKPCVTALFCVWAAVSAVHAAPRPHAAPQDRPAAAEQDALEQPQAEAGAAADPSGEASPFGPLALKPETALKVDERALRYYAAQKDRKRVEAEIRRLRALNPRWTPPHNLYSPTNTGSDEQPLWDLFGAGKLEELRARIAQRMAKDPTWGPSYDLKTKLERRDIRDRLVAASETRQWPVVLELARATPAILSCADIDAVWRVGEASAQSGEVAQATAIYRSILTACTDPGERLTTVRKAVSLLPVEEVKILIALGARNADGTGEFDEVRIDMLRTRIAKAMSASAKDRADAEDLTAEELKEFGEAAVRLSSANDAGLLGWLYYSRKDWAQADIFFRSALQWQPDAKLAEGHALSLYYIGLPFEAEAVAYEWRDQAPAMRALYYGFIVEELTRDNPRAFISAARVANFVNVVTADRSATGAQALGWHHFIHDNAPGALAWFKDALDWFAAQPPAAVDERIYAKTAEGYALSLNRLGRLDEAEALAFEWRMKSPSLRALYVNIASVLLRRTDPLPVMGAPKLEAIAEIVREDRSFQGAQALAWHFNNTRRFAQSVDWFKTAISWSGDGKGDAKTNEGYALALQGTGELEAAAAVTLAWSGRAPAMSDLYIVVVVEELTRQNPPPRVNRDRLAAFVTEVLKRRSVNGAQALGWYHHNLREFEGSLDWFKTAIAWTADGKGDAKMNEGYALSMKALTLLPEGERVAWDWAERSSDLRRLYTMIVIEELTRPDLKFELGAERLANFVRIVSTDKMMAGAQALGWHHFGRDEWPGSLAWFRLALDWAKDGPETSAEAVSQVKAAEGYALSLQKLGRFEEAEAMAWQWHEKSPVLRLLYISLVGQIMRAENAPDLSAERMERFETLVRTDKSMDGAQALGWLLHNTKSYAQSVVWFRNAIEWSPGQKGDAKTNEGYALALKNSGDLDEAEAVTYAWRKAAEPMKKLYVLVVVEELTKDSPARRMPRERLSNFVKIVADDKSMNGAQALGWYHHGHGQYEGAVAWFKHAIDWSPDAKGDNKMNEGYGLALKALVFLPEAEFVTWPWVERDKDLRKLYTSVMIEELTRENPPPPIPEPRIANYVGVITPDRSWMGAQALGWYRYNRKEWQGAADWFSNSLSWAEPLDPLNETHAKTAEGLALALRALGRMNEALALAYEWRERSASMRALYIGFVADALMASDAVPEDVFANFVTLVRADKSARGAQALGWQAFSRKDMQGAADWFKNGLDWAPAGRIEPRVFAKMAEGYVLAMRSLGRHEEAAKLAYEWRDRGPALRGLYVSAMSDLLRRPVPAPAPDAAAVERFAALVKSDKSVTGAQTLGWYYQRKNEFPKAADWFTLATGWSSEGVADVKTAEGYALALKGLGKLAESQALIAEWREKSPEMRTLFINAQIEGLSHEDPAHPLSEDELAKLGAAVTADRMAGGAQSLGWYKFNKKQFADAAAWFKSAVAWSPEGKPDVKIIEGLAITLRQMNKPAEAQALAYDWRERAPSLRALYIEMAIDELTRDNPAPVITPDRLARMAGLFNADKSAPAAQAMGWHRLSRKEWAPAADWFKSAIDWSNDGRGDAKTAEGLAIALQNLGRFDEAETAVYAWSSQSAEMRGLYINIIAGGLTLNNPPRPMNTDQLKRYAAAVVSERSGNGAQALAWYSYNIGQYVPAAAWFDKAMAWQPAESSAVGLALTYRRMNDAQAFAHVVDLYRDAYPKVAELLNVRVLVVRGGRRGGQGAGSAIYSAFKAKDYARCIGLADAQESLGRISAGDSLIKGWCLMAMSRPQEATYAFDHALASQGKGREDAAYGKSLALLRSKSTDEAAMAAQSANLSPQRRNEIGVEVLTQRAQAAFRANRFAEALSQLDQRAAFAPEQRDLMMIRGWSLYHLKSYPAARNVFLAVDRQLSSRDSQAGLGAVEAKMHPVRE